MNSAEWHELIAEWRRRVDETLDRHMPMESEPPELLHRAMRYSLFAGGKRLRPILCLLSCEAAGGHPEKALLPAAAIELLHTYTLIHDDLPAMDNDDLRRGRPTAHRVFGEANAILAGDALLTLAFEWLAECPAPPPRPPGMLAHILARAAGSRGVAGGQYADLAAEGRPVTPEQLTFIHRNKTAVLLGAACRMGAVIAEASEDIEQKLQTFGEHLGMAFQIADDILNATASPEQLGKATGTDAARGKATYVALYGLEKAAEEARAYVQKALHCLAGLPGPTEALAETARFAAARDH